MSLRARLLLAVGIISLTALGVADVATYSALRSFLFKRVDQTLATTQSAVQDAIVVASRLPSRSTPQSGAGLPPGALSVAPGTFVQVRTSAGTPVAGQAQAAVMPGGKTYTPSLPSQITLPRGSGPGATATYFTTPASQAAGPPFRVGASSLPNGEQLIVAVSLADTMATLDRLLVIELCVSAAALAACGLLGWWLVRVGLRPLAAVERTADAIAADELHHRIPGETTRTEVGRLARALNVMLARIEEAFTARDATVADLRRSEERLRSFVADASHELRTRSPRSPPR